jgi:hypothetical protein
LRINLQPVETLADRGSRQAAYAILDEISRKMAGEDPEVIDKTIKEAVREARKQ